MGARTLTGALDAGAEVPPEERVIDVRDLRMRYGTTDVLRGVGFAARRGEVLALLGPNGAGKTTTIEILEGFRVRSAGDVRVLGVDPVAGREAWRARIGVVLQSWRDHGKWRVRELLDHLGSYYAPYSTAERTRPWQVDELLDVVGLTSAGGTRIARLSGGQRRRLDVAIGIVGRPELLFLDEPTVGFDPEARREFHDLVHRLTDVDDTTVLLTTHDLDEAEKLADRILILAAGRIVADGSADELSRRVAGESEVRWTRDGQRFVHAAADATGFVRDLFRQYGESIGDLEVRRASLRTIPGTTFPLGAHSLVSSLGLLVTVAGVMTMGQYLTMDREDGTLLRAKATPNGMVGYLIGKIVLVAGVTVVSCLVVLVPGLFVVDGLRLDETGALTLLWLVPLALLATMPLGAVLGALFDNARSFSMIMLPVMGLTAISGIFYPVTAMPGWLQGVAQAFPMYWLGLGLRSVFLPGALAVAELGGSWRHGATAAMLAAWAVLGIALAPGILRRMARRESGSAVAARRARAMTRMTV